MKLFNAIAAATMVGAMSMTAVPAKSSSYFDLFRGTHSHVNDGNPYDYIVRGEKTLKIYNPDAAYPLSRLGPGAQRVDLSMDRESHRVMSETFNTADRLGKTYRNATM